MILIIGTVRIAESALEAARPVMARMIEASRAEAGCVSYAYSIDVLDPTVIHVTEAWSDRAALMAHFATPHLAEWRAHWADLGIDTRDLRLYETGDGEPL